MVKLTIDDLLHLLDSQSDFDEVACFARDLEVPELGLHVESPHEPGKVTLGSAMGNCMRTLRVEEKLGIVIVSSLPGNPPLDDWIRVSRPTYTFTSMLDRASRVLFDGPSGTTGKVWLGHMGLTRPVAMLRKIEEKLHHNLVMELTTLNGRVEWIGFQGPLCAWVTCCLWADVPTVLDEEHPRCSMSLCRECFQGRCTLDPGTPRATNTKECVGFVPRPAVPTSSAADGASCDECGADPECADCGHPSMSEPESPKKVPGIPPTMDARQVLDTVAEITRKAREAIGSAIYEGASIYGSQWSLGEEPMAQLRDALDRLDGLQQVVPSLPNREAPLPAQGVGATVRPFPGTDAHPDKHRGELCIEGTKLRVRDFLLHFEDEWWKADSLIGRASKDYGIESPVLQGCLRGLADWLKTQNWTGTKPTKLSGTETGRWVCGEELAGFRCWQDHRDQGATEKDSPRARYVAMTPEEFGQFRGMADEGMKPRLGTSEADRLVVAWATRLSRALDIIERVTGERDACAKNGILRLQELAALHAELADTRVEADLLGRARGTLINIAEGYTAEGGPVEQAKKWLEADAQAIRTVIHLTPEASAKVDEMLRHPQEPTQVLKDLMASAPEPRKRDPGLQAVGGHRCPKCKVVFLDEGNVKDGIATCPGCRCSWLIEKRCGTCAFGGGSGSRVRIEVHDVQTASGVAAPVAGTLLADDDGPPWPNCRFWKPRE